MYSRRPNTFQRFHSTSISITFKIRSCVVESSSNCGANPIIWGVSIHFESKRHLLMIFISAKIKLFSIATCFILDMIRLERSNMMQVHSLKANPDHFKGI
ncbi:hypothetical protein MtrunA17_Chr7g0239981 [Medicago truncatula]|uniref:Transmembrane protein n=1 Tax=Medicago truncatula TaxID=3880 RepID=A0A396H3E7_MEDTR|nr:hypothetical protein MtrunA17_Chr7g0239981 [Medicago truncatula]